MWSTSGDHLNCDDQCCSSCSLALDLVACDLRQYTSSRPLVSLITKVVAPGSFYSYVSPTLLEQTIANLGRLWQTVFRQVIAFWYSN